MTSDDEELIEGIFNDILLFNGDDLFEEYMDKAGITMDDLLSDETYHLSSLDALHEYVDFMEENHDDDEIAEIMGVY